jgi:hypothetical protein
MSLETTEPLDEHAHRLRVVMSYAREDQLEVEFLLKALADLQQDGWVDAWHDERLEAGSRFEDELQQRIESADIILLLLSDAFLISDFCVRKELQWALRRSCSDAAVIVPVLLRPLATIEEAHRRLDNARRLLVQAAEVGASDELRTMRVELEQRAVALADWPDRLTALTEVMALQRVPRGPPLHEWNNVHSAWANVAFHLRRVVVRRATSGPEAESRRDWVAYMRRRLSRLRPGRPAATYLPGDTDDDVTPEPLDDAMPIGPPVPSRTITLIETDERGAQRAQYRLRTGALACAWALCLGLVAGFIGAILSARLQRSHAGDTWIDALLLMAPIVLCVISAGSAFWASKRFAPPARARDLSLPSLIRANVTWMLRRTVKHSVWMLPVACLPYLFGGDSRRLLLDEPAFRALIALTLGALELTPRVVHLSWRVWRARRP